MHGFLNLNKPAGMTSHDVVDVVRRLLALRRVGHAGTLDPMACGVLPVCLGRATRLAERIASGEKEYVADIRLGISTSTDDLHGEVIGQRPVPPMTSAEVESHLQQFVGVIEQVPPAYSAVKVSGRRAYELARKGMAVALPPRRVTIYEIALLEWKSPDLTVRVRCSRGTYIRALARDLGRKLGTGGALARLVRTRVGVFRIEDAITLPQLRKAVGEGSWRGLVLPPDFALQDLPALRVPHSRADDIKHGRSWSARPEEQYRGWVRAYCIEGEFLGVVELDPGSRRWWPRLSFI